MPIIKLQSSDGEIFDVDIEVAKCSITIKTMLEDLGLEDDENEVVPLPVVSGAILRKIIEWATYHKDHPQPKVNDDGIRREFTPWDGNFLKVDDSILLEIILASNYLNIRGLMSVACKKVADMMKGKCPEELRKIFNLKNDLADDDEKEVYEQEGCCPDGLKRKKDSVSSEEKHSD